MTKKKRADMLLLERGLVESRSKAQAIIMAGQAFANDQRIDKAGQKIADDAQLRLKGQRRYVSRGGDKLAHAIEDLGVACAQKVCLDIGASTGGFSDCLLQGGASQLYAVDVGYGQLHQKLRSDPRVDVRERTNARHLRSDDFNQPIDLVVVDASFIGLEKLADAIARVLPPGGRLLALIKPQFEVGRAEATRSKGVIRDPIIRKQAIERATAALLRRGFDFIAGTDCKVPGPKGNREYFLYAQRTATPDAAEEEVPKPRKSEPQPR
jgi:23S rRNA (cytidine1920-2'-O)/16S rRNA (cytidine1409-2'-O)-methyltransferase